MSGGKLVEIGERTGSKPGRPSPGAGGEASCENFTDLIAGNAVAALNLGHAFIELLIENRFLFLCPGLLLDEGVQGGVDELGRAL